jgi:hypothetical protein
METLTGLAERLLSAIAEVERVAGSATPGPWTTERPPGAFPREGVHSASQQWIAGCDRADAEHIALHDPQTELRRCAAHRKIVERYVRLAGRESKTFAMCAKLDALEEVLLDLADGYGLAH